MVGFCNLLGYEKERGFFISCREAAYLNQPLHQTAKRPRLVTWTVRLWVLLTIEFIDFAI